MTLDTTTRPDRPNSTAAANTAVAPSVGSTFLLAAIACAIAAVALIAFWPSGSDAQGGSLSVSPTARAGDTVTMTATNCPDPSQAAAGAAFRVEFTLSTHDGAGPTTIGNPGSSGVVTRTISIPADTAPGTYSVSAVCVIEELTGAVKTYSYGSASFDVTEAAPTTEAQPTATAAPTSTPTEAERLPNGAQAAPTPGVSSPNFITDPTPTPVETPANGAAGTAASGTSPAPAFTG